MLPHDKQQLEERTAKCFKCQKQKPLAEFSVSKGRKNRLQSKCKDCDNTRVRDRRQYYRDYQKKVASIPKERIKIDARVAARNAIAKGLIEKESCEVCHNDAEAHHDDYSKPLEVRWLCKTHHGRHHRALQLTALQTPPPSTSEQK